MSKRSIGVIIDNMDSQHQSKICEALILEAEKRDCDLLFFCGIAMEDMHEASAPFETIFNLPNASSIDGIILVLSFLQGISGNDLIKKLGEKFSDFPLVSIAVPMENATSVLVDNVEAMTQVIEHVTTHVNMNEIGFISGPLKSKEAMLRLEAYKNQQMEHEVEFDKKLFFEGDFDQISGKKAIDYFQRVNNKIPRAIIAANDDMAIGAYLRLQELGYCVPEDVILTGFDNIDTVQSFSPSFTTYDQRPDLMARLAMEALEDYDENATKRIFAEGKLAVRESCGCVINQEEVNDRIGTYNDDFELDYNVALETAYEQCMDMMDLFEKDVIETIAPFVPEKQIYRQLASLMIKGCFDDLREHEINGKFISSFNAIINNALVNNNLRCDPQKLILNLRRRLLNQMKNASLYRHTQEILFLTESLLGDRLRKRDVQHQMLFKRMFIMSRIMTKSLNAAESKDDLIYIVHHSLSEFGINKCYICLYDRPMKLTTGKPFEYPKLINLVLAYENGNALNIQKFETKEILPKGIINGLENEKLIFLTLFDEQTQYGYIAFSVDRIDAMVYETLRSTISSALKRLDMKKKQAQAEVALNSVLSELEISNELLKRQSIRDELTGLYNRRGFYKNSEQYIEEATAIGEKFVVIFGDIDNLKQINDGYGHNEGDFAIKKIATILKKSFGHEAIIARMSGDEFTILLKNEEEESIIDQLIETTTDRIKEFNAKGEKAYTLGISLGYSIYDYREPKTIDQLLKFADVKLYREKQRKKNGDENLKELYE